ncbi:MAG: lipoate--protein ligase family protein [Chloroflexota bacterium]|nr:MAG: lipoate--protein ligase family protein [Chloroflexota bacterium]
MAPAEWRLIRTPPAEGAWNMAVDEAILEFAGRGDVPPTLRLYAWYPACLSLGYGQPVDDADLDRLKKRAWGLVRRPTGGRAILHTDELTYCVCGPQDEPILSGSVLESYHRLSQALLAALQLLGIHADAEKRYSLEDTQSKENPVCFEVPSNYEITVSGKKIVGSAQSRKKSSVLQHGTLPLYGDFTRIIQVLKFSNHSQRQNSRQRLLSRATTVESVIGYRGDWWIAAQAFQIGFTSALNLNLQKSGLTAAEGRRAMELYQEKFNNREWTEKF